MPQLRKNPVTREWVVIATERSKRPSDFVKSEITTDKPEHSDNCPFCIGNEGMTPPEVLAFRSTNAPNTPGWWVRVVPNKFPALSIDGELDRHGAGMYDFMNGIGAHEVIVETPEHNKCMATVGSRQAEEVWWACAQRMRELGEDPRFKYILVFRNHGKVAGASLEHPHSQLIALPMVPIEVKTEIAGAKQYYDYHDRCIFCDMIRQERNFGKRVVMESDNFLVFEPFAPKYPFETWVIPKKHSRSFVEDAEELIPEFSKMAQGALKRIGKCLDYPPYNYTLHTAPCNVEKDQMFHWHLEIMPRLTIAAGFEMGTGVYINVTAPEDAAEHLRAAGEELEELAEPAVAKTA
ncbi:MAG: galactose-1-phosphate uridylyltransferase [Armatimonadota bacterium]